MLAQLSTLPPAPSTLVHDVPPAVDQILHTALAKDPAKRFADIREFRVAIEGVLSQCESGPQEQEREKPKARKNKRLQRAGKTRLSVLFGVLSFSAGFAGVFLLIMRH
jgi:hypothetical protein